MASTRKAWASKGAASGISLAALLAAAAPAQALDGLKFYGRGDVGYSFSETFDGNLSAGQLGPGDFDETVIAGGGLGFQTWNLFAGAPWLELRSDVTFTLRQGFELSGVEPFLGSTLTARGDVDNWTVMGNLYADFDLGRLGVLRGLHAYVGGGVGYARNQLETVSFAIDGFALGTQDGATTDELAWAAMAGLSYDVSDWIALDVGYRYVDLGEVSTGTTLSTAPLPVAAAIADLTAHEVQAGVRFSFWKPPAPAAAPPALPPAPVVQTPEPPPPAPMPPEVARNFLVFFDWDSTEILPQAEDTIRQAVAAAQQVGVTRIDLTGHADRSGSPGYNLALSERRAQSVANAMVALGVPASDIMLVGRGEEQPLVPTPDGVREPQNRRVEIVF
ncbi:OmpA family protein [Zavarzinia sp. CC-PAN008]|uniref:OmpA family protein n=1 Tax=Zavarzinia sp. CC-PAN008 TaxID=3243332 RepID=UPI003F744C32